MDMLPLHLGTSHCKNLQNGRCYQSMMGAHVRLNRYAHVLYTGPCGGFISHLAKLCLRKSWRAELLLVPGRTELETT